MKALIAKIRRILRNRRTRLMLSRTVSIVAAFVVFVTTYALVLPAITMEKEAKCGVEAHQHDDSCYELQLTCTQEEADGHAHTEDCYQVEQVLTCEIPEHQHSAENGCYDEEGNLVCTETEHVHDSQCYQENRELVCGLEQSGGHHHDESCYEKILICGKQVHTHGPECYEDDAGAADPGFTDGEGIVGPGSVGTESGGSESGQGDFGGDDQGGDVFDGQEYDFGAEGQGGNQFDQDPGSTDFGGDDFGGNDFEGRDDFSGGMEFIDAEPGGDSFDGGENWDADFTEETVFTDAEPPQQLYEEPYEEPYGESYVEEPAQEPYEEPYQEPYEEPIAEEAPVENGALTGQDDQNVQESGEGPAPEGNHAEGDEAEAGQAGDQTVENAESAGTETDAAAADQDAAGQDAAGQDAAGQDAADPETADLNENQQALDNEIDKDAEKETGEKTEAADSEDDKAGDREAAENTDNNTDKKEETDNKEADKKEAGQDGKDDQDTSGTADSAKSNTGAAPADKTDTKPESTGYATETTAAEAYVPALDALDFNAILDKNTGIYYHAVEEDGVIEDSSLLYDWEKVKKDTELAPNDLLRIYLSYTIPAGSLNATNDIARYRLPGNIHLSDAQKAAINGFENGISGQYMNYDALEITDPGRHTAYIGAEAVEGRRRPGQTVEDYLAGLDKNEDGTDPQELISAVVRTEDVCDAEGSYIGTDLVFTFSTYTVDRNQHEYDKDGNQTKAGEKVCGWFCFDLNTSQIDWATVNVEESLYAVEAEGNTAEENGIVGNGAEETGADGNGTVDGGAAENDAAAAGQAETPRAEESLPEREEAAADQASAQKADAEAAGADDDPHTTEARDENTAENADHTGSADAVQGAAEDNSEASSVGTEKAENSENVTAAETAETAENTDNAEVAETDGAAENAEYAEAAGAAENVENTEAAETAEALADEQAADPQAADPSAQTNTPAAPEIVHATYQIVTTKEAEIIFAAAVIDEETGSEKETISTKLVLKVTEFETRDELREPSADDPAIAAGEAEPGQTAQTVDEEKPAYSAESENTQAADAGEGAENKEDAETAGEEKSSEADKDKAEKDKAAETDKQDQKKTVHYPAATFEDTITVHMGTLSTDTDSAAGLDIPEITDLTVHVEADAGTFPEGTTMVLTAVTGNDLDDVAQAVEGAVEGKTKGFYAVDITFKNADGKVIEPRKPVKVTMKGEPIRKATENASTEPVVVHLEDTAAAAASEAGQEENGQAESNPEAPEKAENIPADESGRKKNDAAATETGDTAENNDSADESAEPAAEAGIEPETNQTAGTDKEPALEKTQENVDASANAGEEKVLDQNAEANHPAEAELPAEAVEEDAADPGNTVETAEEKPAAAPTATVVETYRQNDTGKAADDKTANDTIMFEGDSFSIYAIVYTVDFHWEVDGRMYEFSLPGGGFVSFYNLVEVLGIVDGTNEGENETENAEITDAETAEGEQTEAPLTLNDIEVSDATREFVANVENIEFSSPDLVWVGKVDEGTTIGGLKEANELDVQYSAELAEEQIAKINAQTVEAGDWALISIQPFESTESLTVTMKTGEVFEIRVTDAYNTAVKLHFVKENGDPLTSISYNGETINAGSNGVFTLTAEWLNSHVDGELDLTKFVEANGYTLSNTHKSTRNDLLSSGNYPHTIIGNELNWDGTDLKYKLYYMNHDKAGWYWFNAGTQPVLDDSHWKYGGHNSDGSYNGNIQDESQYSDPKWHDTVADNVYDYYLVYSPAASNGNGSGNGNQSVSPEDLDDIGKTKTLTPNDDGTYTMDLSVTTDSLPHEEQKGVNLIIVFDTSSSMGRSVYDSNTKVGKDNEDSRFYQTAAAMDAFFEGLYKDVSDPNSIKLSLVDFNLLGYTRTINGSSWTSDYEAFMRTVRGLSITQGTNWADGLQKAISSVPDPGNNNPTYVLLMTDGAPSQYWHSNKSYFVSGEGCYLGARDEARAVVNDGKELYGIFSYGDDQDEQNGYLTDLVNYAYDANVPDHSVYASTTDELQAALANIMKKLYGKIAHTGVNYYDGIALDTTSTALNINVNGNLGSITYSKIGGTSPSYTVVTKRDGTIESFKIAGTEYKDDAEITTKQYKRISGGTSETPGITVADATATVYQCTVESGSDKGTYTMPIATLAIDDETEIGDLNWDLSPLGLLEYGATYKISFVVWPDQKAYDYVADLNNGTMQWNTATEEAVYAKDEQGHDTETILYYRKGVSQYPNIVRYPCEEGEEPVYAALTNTSQEVTYYIADEINGDGTSYYGQYTTDPPTPAPMPLTATESALEKAWSVDRDPGIMAQLLYDTEGNSTHFQIEYDVIRDKAAKPYKTITLGWDDELGAYVWKTSSVRTVIYNGHPVQVGMSWAEDFDISVGLMLSDDQMDERGLDKAAYPSGEYPEGSGKIYYILEPGHDYEIKEHLPESGESWVTYEFDFVSPVYHPMLVDGTLRSVNFTGYTDGMATSDSVHEITITEMSDASVAMNSLKVENTLRGYINLEKDIVDKDGRTPRPDDNTEFTYRIELRNSTDPGPFTVVGSNVPWYGISGLFYHDTDGNYYQAETNTTDKKAHRFMLTTESGAEYEAWCSDENGVEASQDVLFYEDVPGPTWITYNDGTQNITILLAGNQMVHDSDNYVWENVKINQDQILNIANVPVGTTYTITEADVTGYDFVSILKEIRNGSTVESSSSSSGSATITGTIVADRDNHITYTNKIHSVDITVKKVDENNQPLTGAVFTLTKAGENDAEDTVYTKPGAGETDTGTYKFSDLPDGSYILQETPPTGYTAIGDVTFTVANGKVTGSVTMDDTVLNSDSSPVSWNGNTLTFTVINRPIIDEGQITVRKQWLDFFGNGTTYNGTVDLKLLQWVENVENSHKVTVNFNYWTVFGQDPVTRTKNGYGEATVEWSWNGYINIGNDRISVSGGNATFESLGNRQYRLTIPDSNSDVTVNVDVNNYGFDPYGTIGNIQIGTTPSVQEGMTLTGGTKIVTLGTGGVWSQQFRVEGNGLLSNDSTTLPATYDGKKCYYTIAEESVPEGFELQQISTDQISSGVLTAYNKRNTVDVSLEKVDKNNRSTRLNGATFALRQIDPTATGNMDTRTLTGGKTDTQTTSGEGSSQGTLTFTSLGYGYYEIKETVAPAGYVLTDDAVFYIRVNESGIQLLRKDENVEAEQWTVISGNSLVTLRNASLTVTNQAGAALPNTGGPGTRIFTILGSILVMFAGAMIWRRRKYI